MFRWAGRAKARIFEALPEGKELPQDEWRARHRTIVMVIWAHVIGVPIFAVAMGNDPGLPIAEGIILAGLATIAGWQAGRRRFRGTVAALALVSSSAAVVQFSGGYIEAHFHFFVVLAVIALYQDWVPFLLAILFVALDHGVVGTIFPELVYNHGDAFLHPWKWALIHASLVLGESVALLMGWKIAEQARRRTALVLDSAGEGIIGLDKDGLITFANPAAASMTRRVVGDMQGARIDDILRSVDGVLYVACSNDVLVPVECERTPIQNRGVVIGSVVTLKDITERKRAEDKLRRAVSTLTATLESTTDGILVIDQGGRIAGFNKKFVELWRIPMSVLASGEDARAIEFVQDQLDDPQGFVRKLRELYSDKEATSFDELSFRDGRVMERYSQPQRSGDEVIGRVWSFRDVTDRKNAESALRRQDALQAHNVRLQEMDQLRSQFINNAAHELGTPLTPIKIQAHMLGNGSLGPLSDRQKMSVAVLKRNVDQLGTLLHDVLDSARIQGGRLELRLSPVDVRLVAKEAVESFHEAARGAGIDLRVEGGAVLVKAEASRVTQVLFNLIRNALKFTPSGGSVIVRVAPAGEGGQGALIEVCDTGVGLTGEDIVKLFKPFSQVHDKMEQTRSGTGLGLFISKGIVESHGGSIEVESPGPGCGSTFRFTLPGKELAATT